jgi:hypothetical protein
MIKSETIKLVSAALVKAQSEMGSATKGSSNPFFKSRYADLNAIREACLPALFANGLSVMQPTVVVDGKNYIETLILHDSGEYIGGHTEIVYAKQNDAQNFGAGTTYARRFGLQALLCIGAEDSDGEEAVGRSTKAAPIKTDSIKSPVATEVEKQNMVEQAKAAGATDTAPPKKTGFGVKATAATVTKTETTDDSWS